MSVCFVPKADSRVHSNPIASNKSAGTFCWYLENRKNLDQPAARVTGYNSVPAALEKEACLLCAKSGHWRLIQQGILY
jgi:hypothetical protein